MEKIYNTLSFEECPPIEILESDFYLNSIKNLSFQYRTKADDELVAYIALAKDHPNVKIPFVSRQSEGCRLLNVWVKPVNVYFHKIRYAELLSVLLYEAEFRINAWVNLQTLLCEFDYLWFYNEDIDESVRNGIGGISTIDNVSYRILERCRKLSR